MTRRSDSLRSRALASALPFLLGIAATSRAGTDVEVFGGVLFSSPAMSETYDASYTPSRISGITQLFEEPDPRSHAAELLALDGETGRGFGLGVNVFPHRVFGLQILLDRGRADLSGMSSPHQVDLVWDSIDFPSSNPVVRNASFSFDTAPTAGRLQELALAFNAVARWRAGSSVSGSFSGGPCYLRVRVEDLELGALAGWLGGHAVLFTELYRMTLATEAAGTLGFDVGGDVSIRLGPKLAVFADGRLFFGPKIQAPVHLGGFVSDNVVTVPIERVEQSLALPPLEIDPRTARVLLGLKWRL